MKRSEIQDGAHMPEAHRSVDRLTPLRFIRATSLNQRPPFPSDQGRRRLDSKPRQQGGNNEAPLLLLVAAWPQGAAAQMPDAASLNPTQLLGRNTFAQHCTVCHVRTQITVQRSYGPALSKNSLGGQDDVLR